MYSENTETRTRSEEKLKMPAKAKAAAKAEITCGNCGSNRFHLEYDFQVKAIYECDQCELMVIYPFPTQAELKQVYNENYFSNQQLTSSSVEGVFGYVDYIYERLHKQAGYKLICEKIKGYLKVTRPAPLLLDFGCGLGYFLDTAHDYGFVPYGVEFNDYAINYIRGKYAYPILKSNNVEEFEQTFDVITLHDVIEHLEDPFALIHKVSAKLNPGGVLVINTMDSKSMMSRLLGKRLEDFRRIREHLFFFSRKNLRQMLEREGFEVLETSFIGHTFELKYLAQRVKTTLPLIGNLMTLTFKVLPFLENMTIYVNPRTKIMMYARKKS